VRNPNQDIVVATTGRLLQYIKEENFDCRAVETLVLDEAFSRRSAKSLMFSPSSVAENSSVCLRQRVSAAMVSISKDPAVVLSR
jgi:hypothetical protein